MRGRQKSRPLHEPSPSPLPEYRARVSVFQPAWIPCAMLLLTQSLIPQLRGEAIRLGEGLFPGKVIVPVALDLGRPLLMPAAAYEALDAVLLDAPSAARVTESQLSVLLAGGVAVAVRSDEKPAGGWPWHRQ